MDIQSCPYYQLFHTVFQSNLSVIVGKKKYDAKLASIGKMEVDVDHGMGKLSEIEKGSLLSQF